MIEKFNIEVNNYILITIVIITRIENKPIETDGNSIWM